MRGWIVTTAGSSPSWTRSSTRSPATGGPPAIWGTMRASRSSPSTHTAAVGPDTRSTTPSCPSPAASAELTSEPAPPGAARRPRTASGAGPRRARPRPPRVPLAPVDHDQRGDHDAAGLPRLLHRRDQGATAGEDVVDHRHRGPLLDERPLDPLLEAVLLRLLAHEEAGHALAPGPRGGAHRAHQGVGAEREAAHRARRRGGEGRPAELAREGRALGIEQHLAGVEVPRGASARRQDDRLSHEGALAQQVRQAGGGVGRGGHPGSLAGERAVADRRRTPSRGAGR